MPNKDWTLIGFLISESKEIIQEENGNEFPLDQGVIDLLSKILSNIHESDEDYIIYNNFQQLKEIWILLIEKSIKCLRYHDTREPFIENSNKKPYAYGIDEIADYFDKYTDFEEMLYGSNKYYRDHVVHVFRTWLLGMECLLKNSGAYLKVIGIDQNLVLSAGEKISIWTMIALTHDLGYPLEKAQQIIGKTQDMMYSFVSNPNISMDLAFSGVQNNMNDYVVRFLSSKMHPKEIEEGKPPLYVARLQPKYYFKFQKSLEHSAHGIVSTIIIYKLLTYFLESDYNINEDYTFEEEDVRQFYIRREILRAIAAHTCRDIYHLYIGSFSFLLIIADDCQEWGRKCISELYIKSNKEYELKNINFVLDEKNKNHCVVDEKFTISENGLPLILKNLGKQYITYIKIFRDGQDTVNRNFTFAKKCEIECECNPKIKIEVEFKISNTSSPSFYIIVNYTGTNNTDIRFDKAFFKKVFGDAILQSGEVKSPKKFMIPHDAIKNVK